MLIINFFILQTIKFRIKRQYYHSKCLTNDISSNFRITNTFNQQLDDNFIFGKFPKDGVYYVYFYQNYSLFCFQYKWKMWENASKCNNPKNFMLNDEKYKEKLQSVRSRVIPFDQI